MGEEKINIQKSLNKLEKQKILKNCFKDKEQLNLFLQVRYEQYIKPYLNWIINKKEKYKNYF